MRTREGMKVARAKGRLCGKKPKLSPRQESHLVTLHHAGTHTSLLHRWMRCGKTSCRCKADPPSLHGPYFQWTRTVAGRTVTKILSAEQADHYQPWFDNARLLRQLITDLEPFGGWVGSVAARGRPRAGRAARRRRG